MDELGGLCVVFSVDCSTCFGEMTPRRARSRARVPSGAARRRPSPSGLTPDEARLAARRAMGSVALVKDIHRDARSLVKLEDLGRDLRHALRTLRRAPGFTFIAVFTLGLGIGVNTTFFTIVNAICLRGLPIESPERVMYVSTRDAKERPGNLSYSSRRAPDSTDGVRTGWGVHHHGGRSCRHSTAARPRVGRVPVGWLIRASW